jgi:aminopeptidase N
MLDLIAARRAGRTLAIDDGLVEAHAALLAGADADPEFTAEALALPSEPYVADQMEVVDPDAIHAVRDFLRAELGRRLGPALRQTYEQLADPGEYRVDGRSIGRRALRNASLSLLAAAGEDGIALAAGQFETARNMTDALAALVVLAAGDAPARSPALEAFHARWRHDDLVLDKWFAIQAASPRPQTVEDVRALAAHSDYDPRNPNRVRALVGAFSAGNQVRFHDATGAGYRFLADTVIALDPVNSQTASRLSGPLGAWRRQDDARQSLMRTELERILATPRLSRLTYEKASKALA